MINPFKMAGDFLSHSWNVFHTNRDPTQPPADSGPGFSRRPDRVRFIRGAERTVLNSIYNRIAVDVADVRIMHASVDINGRFDYEMKTKLNRALSIEANADQTGRALIQDIVMSMFDEGAVAVVPTYTSKNMLTTDAYDIFEMRTAKIIEWFPHDVRVRLYDDRTGYPQEVVLPKNKVAIIENPFYSVMNEPNSTAHRLMMKLALLDSVDKQLGSDKLNMLIQLPYVVKSDAKLKIANERMEQLERQLEKNNRGVGYIDATEKVIQLNKPLENNLLEQITYFETQLLNQLNMTKAVFDGTATEEQMLNYYNRTIVPILAAITEEMTRKFLSPTAQTQRKAIIYLNNPFKLATTDRIAEIADKFTRNEVLSSNEIRAIIGYKPVNDDRADELRNKNLNRADNEVEGEEPMYASDEEYDDGDYE